MKSEADAEGVVPSLANPQTASTPASAVQLKSHGTGPATVGGGDKKSQCAPADEMAFAALASHRVTCQVPFPIATYRYTYETSPCTRSDACCTVQEKYHFFPSEERAAVCMSIFMTQAWLVCFTDCWLLVHEL